MNIKAFSIRAWCPLNHTKQGCFKSAALLLKVCFPAEGIRKLILKNKDKYVHEISLICKASIKRHQTVDIYLIKCETVIVNGTNFKIYQIIWNLLL